MNEMSFWASKQGICIHEDKAWVGIYPEFSYTGDGKYITVWRRTKDDSIVKPDIIWFNRPSLWNRFLQWLEK